MGARHKPVDYDALDALEVDGFVIIPAPEKPQAVQSRICNTARKLSRDKGRSFDTNLVQTGSGRAIRVTRTL